MAKREIRTTPLYQSGPATTNFQECCVCGKTLARVIDMVHLINGGADILHPDDEHLYESNAGNCGCFPIGADCARRVGMEWTFKNPRFA